jgi:P27 family predicted phage terminase small subunit
MRGRKPLPRATKIIRGTFRSCRDLPAPEPARVELVPAPPAGLGAHGKALWRSLAEELVAKGLLTVLDLATLEVLCSAFQVYKECSDAIYRPGGRKRTLAAYMRTRTQQTALELSTMRAAFGTYKSLMAEFGLSPSSRTRLHVAPPKTPEVDPMEAILARP